MLENSFVDISAETPRPSNEPERAMAVVTSALAVVLNPVVYDWLCSFSADVALDQCIISTLSIFTKKVITTALSGSSPARL